MSWSDDTRCLYCDGKLPLYRKLTNGQFCSTGHQKAYWKEQERLAVEVLHRTHDALMAFRPAQDIELIIGPAVGWNGQSPDAPPTQAPPSAQEPVRREPVAPRVERPAEPVRSAEPVRPPEPVHVPARPIAQSPPAAQAPPAPEPAPPSFADFIHGSPEGLSPSWTVLPLMQAVEPVQEEPAFLDLLIRNSGELTVLAVVLDVHDVEEPVEIPIHHAGPVPLASRSDYASRLEYTSRLEQTEDALLALAENVGSIQPVREPEPAHALHQETALHPLVPEVKSRPATLKPAAFDRLPEPVAFVQLEPVKVPEPVVVIERGVLERLAVPESDRVFLQRETSMVAMGPDAEVAPAAEATATAPVSQSLLVTEVVEQAAANSVAGQPVPPLAGWQHYEASFAAAGSDTASLVAIDCSPEIPSDFSSRIPAMLEEPALATSAFEHFRFDLAGWQHYETSFAAAWSDTPSVVASECSPELPTDFTSRMPDRLEKPALAVSALEPFSAGPEQSVEDSGPVPPMAGAQHYEASFAAAWSDTASLVASGSSPELSMHQMLGKPALSAASAFEPFSARLERPVELTLEAAEVAPQPRSAALTWFRLGAFNPPLLITSSLTGFEPHVRLAGGCRYAMNGLSQASPSNPSCAPLSLGAERRAIEYPKLADSDWQAGMQTNFAPGFAALDNLSAWKAEMSAHAIPREKVRKSATEPVAASSPFWIPALRLQPLRWVSSQPLAPMPVEEAPKPAAAAAPEFPAPPKEHPQIGHLLVGFWKNAPRDLRLLVFAIPALLALAFHPSLPKVHVSTVQATEPVEKNVGQAVNGSWNSFKQVVSERAAVQLDEDFRTGLDDWSSPGGTATEWSFDANGFVRPGSLALYSPSLSLADYEAQFLAIIDQKALSWVVRAEDFSNYYVIKLVVLKPGPLTTLGLTRYAVINGKPQNRVDAVVPFTARPDMIYRVRMDIHDDSYVLAIQGQIVDAWSEPRLKKGGIGFYSARGEESRVRWVQVSHQYDMLGRLCSYLAPYDLSATSFMPTESTTKNSSTKDNGSWQR